MSKILLILVILSLSFASQANASYDSRYSTGWVERCCHNLSMKTAHKAAEAWDAHWLEADESRSFCRRKRSSVVICYTQAKMTWLAQSGGTETQTISFFDEPIYIVWHRDSITVQVKGYLNWKYR